MDVFDQLGDPAPKAASPTGDVFDQVEAANVEQDKNTPAPSQETGVSVVPPKPQTSAIANFIGGVTSPIDELANLGIRGLNQVGLVGDERTNAALAYHPIPVDTSRLSGKIGAGVGMAGEAIAAPELAPALFAAQGAEGALADVQARRESGENITTNQKVLDVAGQTAINYLFGKLAPGQKLNTSLIKSMLPEAMTGIKATIAKVLTNAGVTATEQEVQQIASNATAKFSGVAPETSLLQGSKEALITGAVFGGVGQAGHSALESIRPKGDVFDQVAKPVEQTAAPTPTAEPVLSDAVKNAKLKSREQGKQGDVIDFATDIEKAKYIVSRPDIRGKMKEQAQQFVDNYEAMHAGEQPPSQSAEAQAARMTPEEQDAAASPEVTSDAVDTGKPTDVVEPAPARSEVPVPRSEDQRGGVSDEPKVKPVSVPDVEAVRDQPVDDKRSNRQRAIDAALKHDSKHFDGEKPALNMNQAHLAKTLKSAGVDVVFYDGKSGRAGFVKDAVPGVLFIDRQRPHASIREAVVHELTHEIDFHHADLFQPLHEAALEFAGEGGMKAVASEIKSRGYGNAEVRKESLPTVMETIANHPEVVATLEPTVRNKLRAVVSKIMAKFTGKHDNKLVDKAIETFSKLKKKLDETKKVDESSTSASDRDRPSTSYGYWATKDGKFLPVGNMEHDNVAADNGLKGTNQALEAGHVRIVEKPGSSEVNIEAKDAASLDRMRGYVRDQLAAEKTIHIDTNEGESIVLNGSNPRKSQEALKFNDFLNPERKSAASDRPTGNKEVEKVADDYREKAGLPPIKDDTYVTVDADRAKKIADWYAGAKDDPTDPAVQKSYKALIDETKAQFQAMTDAGYKVEPWTGEGPAYKDSKAMRADVEKNHHLFFDPTSKAFGKEGEAAKSKNPMLDDSGFKDAKGNPLPANDLFRAVHDFFGHAKKGFGFGARGEENAWRQHMTMYSDEAKPAMTAETRGQNSYVNFGPDAEHNRASPWETKFAPQKSVIAPDWVVHEGSIDDTKTSAKDDREEGDLSRRVESPEGRKAYVAEDAKRETENKPGVRKDADVIADAKKMVERGDPAIHELLKKAGAGESFTDVETRAVREIIDKRLPDAIFEGRLNEVALLGRLIAADRAAGSEQARAFRQRRDPITPEKHLQNVVAEALAGPEAVPEGGKRDKPMFGRKKKLKTAGEKIDEKKRAIERQKKIKTYLEESQIIKQMTKENLADPVFVGKMLNKLSTLDPQHSAFYEYFLASTLSGPLTQVRNALGNVTHAGVKVGIRPLEMLLNLAVKDPESAQWGEGRYLVQSMGPRIMQAYTNAVQSFQAERPVFNGRLVMSDGKITSGPVIKGRKGEIIRTPLRLLTAVDQFVKTITGTGQAGVEAFRTGKAEGLKPGSKEMDAFVEKELADPDSESWVKAYDYAKELAFQGESGPVTKALIQLRDAKVGGFQPMRYVILGPFVRIASAIAHASYRYSPAGSLSLALRAATGNLSRSQLVQRGAEQIAAWATTAALWELVGDKDNEPFITGSATQQGRTLAYATAPPQSIRLPGIGWVSYKHLQPLSNAVTMAIDAINGVKGMAAGQSSEAAIGDMFSKVVEQTKNQTFLSSVGDFIDALKSPDKAQQLLVNFGTSWIPNALKSPMYQFDPNIYEQRKLRDVSPLDRVLERISPMLTDILPKVDPWGAEVKKGGNGVERQLSPFTRFNGDVNPLDTLVARHNREHPESPYYADVPSPTITIGKEHVDMDRREYSLFLRLGGRRAAIRLTGTEKRDPTDALMDHIDKERDAAYTAVRPQFRQALVFRKAGMTDQYERLLTNIEAQVKALDDRAAKKE